LIAFIVIETRRDACATVDLLTVIFFPMAGALLLAASAAVSFWLSTGESLRAVQFRRGSIESALDVVVRGGRKRIVALYRLLRVLTLLIGSCVRVGYMLLRYCPPTSNSAFVI
jgi:hypothetical protein